MHFKADKQLNRPNYQLIEWEDVLIDEIIDIIIFLFAFSPDIGERCYSQQEVGKRVHAERENKKLVFLLFAILEEVPTRQNGHNCESNDIRRSVYVVHYIFESHY